MSTSAATTLPEVGSSKEARRETALTRSNLLIELINEQSQEALSVDERKAWEAFSYEHHITTIADFFENNSTDVEKDFLLLWDKRTYKYQNSRTIQLAPRLCSYKQLGYLAGTAAEREDGVEDTLVGMRYFVPEDVKKSCFVNRGEAIEKYEDLAVNVSCTEGEIQENGRSGNFSLVLGPSGSGKSFFALRGVASRIYPNGENFTCMTMASLVTPEQEGEKSQRVDRLKKNLVGRTRVMINQALKQRSGGFQLGETQALNGMNLCVVIDEAGISGFSDLLKEEKGIQQIAMSLEAICANYTLILVGTGLAKVTKDVDSNRPFSKFKMKEWEMSHFEQMVGPESFDKRPTVVQIVSANPRLQSMISNPRCAFFLVKAIKRQQTFTPPFEVGRAALSLPALTFIVVEVAHQYMDQNALKDLKEDAGKAQLLAKAVLLALRDDIRKYNKHKNEGTARSLEFPDFAKYVGAAAGPYINKLGNGIIDVHIETEGGSKRFMNNEIQNKYAISLSPAIALVLSVLLGGDNALTLDWLSFETTVAMGEFHELLKETPSDTIVESPFLLVHSQQQLPGQLKNTLRIPKSLRRRVIVNGPRAEFGDVIAPRRLSQAKFTTGEVATLRMLEELHKFGVTTNMHYKKQQLFTNVLLQRWDKDETACAESDMETSGGSQDGIGDFRRENYAASLLMVEQLKDQSLACEEITHKKATTNANKEKKASGKEQKESLKLVFATNAQRFLVPSFTEDLRNGEAWKKRAQVLGLGLDNPEQNVKGFLKANQAYGETVTISRQDVATDGKLCSEKQLPAYINECLRQEIAVDILFMFY